MEDSERLAIAVEALQEIADDCARCDGTGAVTVTRDPKKAAETRRCPSCVPAREALRTLGVVLA